MKEKDFSNSIQLLALFPIFLFSIAFLGPKCSISMQIISFGLLLAGNSFLYSVGMKYLPVSTVTLISASQLAFNAFFSYF